jgi:hypothetical protein
MFHRGDSCRTAWPFTRGPRLPNRHSPDLEVEDVREAQQRQRNEEKMELSGAWHDVVFLACLAQHPTASRAANMILSRSFCPAIVCGRGRLKESNGRMVLVQPNAAKGKIARGRYSATP